MAVSFRTNVASVTRAWQRGRFAGAERLTAQIGLTHHCIFTTPYVSHKTVCDTSLSQTTQHFKARSMPRLTPTPELDRLVELIGIAYDGVGIDTIAQQWGTPIHRRTLQRRLALLVAQQRIEMLGDRRTARYRRRSSAVIHAQ